MVEDPDVDQQDALETPQHASTQSKRTDDADLQVAVDRVSPVTEEIKSVEQPEQGSSKLPLENEIQSKTAREEAQRPQVTTKEAVIEQDQPSKDLAVEESLEESLEESPVSEQPNLPQPQQQTETFEAPKAQPTWPELQAVLSSTNTKVESAIDELTDSVSLEHYLATKKQLMDRAVVEGLSQEYSAFVSEDQYSEALEEHLDTLAFALSKAVKQLVLADEQNPNLEQFSNTIGVLQEVIENLDDVMSAYRWFELIIPDMYSEDYLWSEHKSELNIVGVEEQMHYVDQVVRIVSFGRKYFDGHVEAPKVIGAQ